MKWFDPTARTRSPAHARVYALYEIAYTAVDFVAALFFLVGSALFFWAETTFAGTWCFVLGSLCFAAKPALRLLRQIAYLRLGDYEKVSAPPERSRGA